MATSSIRRAAAAAGISWEQWVTITSLLIAAVVDAVAYFVFGLKSNSFYYFLLWSTVSALVADRVARVSLENKFIRLMDSLNARNEDLQYWGTAVDAMSWFSAHSSGLTSVDNTVFRSRDGKHGFVIDHIEDYLHAIRSSLNRECRWRDLFLSGQEDAYYKFVKTLSPKQHDHYQAAIVKENVPLFQMMILRYENDPPAVLFGWGYQSGKSAHVFISRAVETVTYFEDYFQALYRDARPLYERDAPRVSSDSTARSPEPAQISVAEANALGLAYIGNSAEGFSWFEKNNKGLREVYNTVYRPTRSAQRYLEDEYKKYFAAIRAAIGNKCVWHDLLCPPLDMETIPLASFHASLSDRQKSGYEAKELADVDLPLLQITVLKYLNGDSKVGVGYGFPGCDETMVFVSSQPKTVHFFETYFRELYNSPKARLLFQQGPDAPRSIFQRLREGIARWRR